MLVRSAYRPILLSVRVKDVAQADFEREVIDRSRDVPVVVDFWADWCGPCRTLGPALERAVERHNGKVELAKVDVDSNQGLAQRYGIRGIPAVKAFRKGELVDEFVGAQPEQIVERFVEGLVPTETDRLVAEGTEESLRQALELEPDRRDAMIALARLLLDRGEIERALELMEPIEGDPVTEGLAARARLLLSAGPSPGPGQDLHEELKEGLKKGLDALRRGEMEAALERLSKVAEEADGETRELVRQVMVGIFTELGPADPLATTYRRKLATALY